MIWQKRCVKQSENLGVCSRMRLIDADALRKSMFSYYPCVNEHSVKHNYSGDTLMDYEVADLIDDCIDNATTIDAVPVVRCRDCKHCEFKEFKNAVCWRRNNLVATEDFCSYGEKREGET